MCKTKLSLLFLIFLPLVFSASDVVVLTQSNFDKEVLNSKLPYFVEFYAPWCGHCKSLAPAWEQVATQLKGVVPVGKVDATQETQLASKYGIRGYPTLKIFKNGKPEDYNGARDARSLVLFATNALPSHVILIDNLRTFEENFWAKELLLPRVILFSSKKATSPLFKSLAIRFKGQFVFGEAREASKEVVDKFGIKSFPSLIVLRSKEEDPIVYEGESNAAGYIKFLSGLADEKLPDLEAENSVPMKKKKVQVLSGVSVIEVAKLDELCSDSICVVGIFADDSELTGRVSLLESLSTAFVKDQKFNFVWVDPSQNEGLRKKFDLAGDSVVVYKGGKRSKFAIVPSFEFKDAFGFLERVLTGDVQFRRE